MTYLTEAATTDSVEWISPPEFLVDVNIVFYPGSDSDSSLMVLVLVAYYLSQEKD
jgi:hypothetical protein